MPTELIRTKVVITNLPKLITAWLAILVVGGLVLVGKVNEVAGVAFLSSTTTYIITNGVRGQRVPADDEDV